MMSVSVSVSASWNASFIRDRHLVSVLSDEELPPTYVSNELYPGMELRQNAVASGNGARPPETTRDEEYITVNYDDDPYDQLDLPRAADDEHPYARPSMV